MPDPDRLSPGHQNNPYRNPMAFSTTGDAAHSSAGMPTSGQQASTATSAVFSLVLALVSPLFLLCLGLSIIPSLIAIIMGHVALGRIKRSGGALTGKGMAIAGLVCGYGVFLLSIMFIAQLVPAIKEGINRANENMEAVERGDADPHEIAEHRFHEAEKKIIGASQGAAHGNSPEAIQLANAFAESMKTLREAYFTKRDSNALSITNGQFITYCELHDHRCAFVVHVPSYRKFTGEAKKHLADLAWAAASATVSDKLQEGDQLGVGLKGTVLYGAIMVGDAGGEKPDDGGDREELMAFFEDEPSAAGMPENESELPSETPAPDSPPDIPAEAGDETGTNPTSEQ